MSGDASHTSPDPDEVPSDAGVGGEVVAGTSKDSPSARPAAGNVQDRPAMDMHETSDQERIDGIVAQTRADFPKGSEPAAVAHALRSRFRDVGIAVPDDEIDRLAAG